MQNPKLKIHFWLLVIGFLLFATNFTYAKEIAIIYSGQTHGMIYPCSCPLDPEGGVARRATVIKQIRKAYPDNLVLDAGDFFAGGLMDEYTQNTELDSQRSLVNLKAMEAMQYDAAAIGDNEFNFGADFFLQNAGKTKLALLSCNLKSDKALPYIIKEVAGVKIGVIAVISASAKIKSGSLEFTDPKRAVSSVVEALKKKDVGIIIILSQLQDFEDVNLVNDVAGIDILISGHKKSTNEFSSKIANTLVLSTSWEGRRINICKLSVEGNKITKFKTEEMELSAKVPDDPEMSSLLPKCFSDANCKQEGFVGTCKDAGNLKSQCEFNKANKVRLLIISPKDCSVCEPDKITSFLMKRFPGLSVSYINYPDKKADALIKDFAIYGLPAYLLGKEVEKEKNFDSLKANLALKGDYYMLSPFFSGFSYFLDRKKIQGNLDIFISLYDKSTSGLLESVKEFNPEVHFLANEQEHKFDAARGTVEVEEYLRAVCVKKYAPQRFWDYISCRAKNIESTWWEDCAPDTNTDKIRVCARGEEGISLLRKNIELNKELYVMMGPAYLMDNQEIFASKGAPTKEELKKIIKR
jgi:hypothetical protein